MGALDSLVETLKATNAQAFQGLILNHDDLDKEIQQLKAWVRANGTARPAPDLIREALGRFYRVPKTDGLRDTRLVAFGCIEPFGEQRQRLIEDSQRFPKLLECVDGYRNEPRPFRRCYKGLLHAYFSYDPMAKGTPEIGQGNWERLRVYLHSRSADLSGSGNLPHWVQALGEHENLLTADPCARYGLSALNGGDGEFTEAQRRLDIPGASWAATRMVLAQIEAATALGDDRFRGYISRLLGLVGKHPLVLNTGLTQVLVRYQRSASPNLHAELRDFSVGHWGNPWLSSNSARWTHVPESTRSMVADWLKLELIQEFFNRLAEDGSSDTRRLKFWQSYHKYIDDMYFALGPRAASNRGGDFKELRRKMEERVLGLDAAGLPGNNAFIMCMGDYVVVEFGVKGNACFIFRRNQLPFALSGRVAGDGTALKHASYVERLLHFDRAGRRWEGVFETALARLLAVRLTRDQAAGGPKGEHIAFPAVAGDTSARSPSLRPPSEIEPGFSLRSLERFCAVRRLSIQDRTPSGGNLWVITDNTDKFVGRQLQAWGFAYKPGKGWWRGRR